MKRLSTLWAICVLFSACSSTESPESIECWIIAPSAAEVLSATVDVQIGFEGPATVIELVVNGESVASTSPDNNEQLASISWDTTQGEEGLLSLVVRASNENTQAETEPLQVTIDNAQPIISLNVERLSILTDEVDLPVSIDEANVETVRLLSDDAGEIAVLSESVESIAWDTTTVDSRVHRLSLEVTDAAGNIVVTDEIPIIVGNNGQLLEQSETFYDPSAWIIIPDPFDPTAEFHRRVIANQAHAIEPSGIVRVISWVTWDPTTSWTLEYSVGQGICPHRGIAYTYEESSTSEVIVDLAWSEVDPGQKATALQYAPTHPADAITFPYNGDTRTCGAFFGHINPLDAAEHEGEEMEFTAHFMFVYER